MQIIRPLIRVIVSIVGALVPLLFLSGSYIPLGSSALGSYLPNLLGKESALYTSLQGSFGASLPVGVLPFGTAGVTGSSSTRLYNESWAGLPERRTPLLGLTLHR